MFNLKEKLRKTREAFSAPLARVLQRGTPLGAEEAEDIEELLLRADVGVEATERILEVLRSPDGDPHATLRRELLDLLATPAPDPSPPAARPRAVVVIGVNGVGKTTSIAKLAHLYRQRGERVILAAADTFRAAAVEQLGVWAQRVGVDMVQHAGGGDPGAVAFDACNAARSRGLDVVVVDTAGRLHTRANLMEELAKVKRVCGKALSNEAVETLLVLDANLGQNSLVQAEAFARHVGADGIVLTKLDSTAKGGVVIAIRQRLGVPVRYIGLGEGLEDFAEFSAEQFVDALLS
jgi:fused signal recognition particle receptor